MTDNDIIKALEVCGNGTRCSECPAAAWCVNDLMLEALDLINRQKEEEDIDAIVKEPAEAEHAEM